MQQARDNDPTDDAEDAAETLAQAEASVSAGELSAGELSAGELSARETENAGPSRALGLSRWVQYVFVVIAAFLFWLFDKTANMVLQTFMDPNPELVTGVSLVAGAGIALMLFRHEPSHRVATEIVGELAKVTWPSRKETYASSVIVIITSLIAAAVIGSFDFVWSAITDLLYKYKV